MTEYNFLQRKKDVLGKTDKSHAGEWDPGIKGLCDKINMKENYYTTSSCSGRILVMIDKPVKGAGLFTWVIHEKTTLKELKEKVLGFKGDELLKFKCEPPIIHIVSKTLEDAEKILGESQKAGFKNSGIISLSRNITVELHGTEKVEFPLFKEGKFLVNDSFLELVIDKSNRKLEKGWKTLERLRNLVTFL